jgi:hypothetical protein
MLNERRQYVLFLCECAHFASVDFVCEKGTDPHSYHARREYCSPERHYREREHWFWYVQSSCLQILMLTQKFYPGFFVRLPDDPPSTILLFKDVRYGSSFPSAILFSFLQPTLHSCAYSVQIQFIPILRGYIIIDYQGNENNVVKTRVSSPVLFEVNLTQLEEETSWKITYNSGSGSFKINKDERD